MRHATQYQCEPEASPEGPPTNPSVAFVLNLARALHQYGTPTDRLEWTMTAVVETLGVTGHFFAIPTGIFASFGSPEEQRTALIRVEPSSANLEKMALLDELTAQVLRSEASAIEGTSRIEQIVAAPPRFGNAMTVLAYGLFGGSGSRFFGGGWREAVLSTLIGLCVGLFAIAMERSEDLENLFAPAAALLVSALAVLSAQVLRPVSVTTVTLSSLLILFPGLTLTLGIRELATRNLVSGTAQLTAAGLVLLELGFGVALGSQITHLFPVPPVTFSPVPLAWWTEGVALLIAPVSIGVLLQARPKDMVWITLSGIVSFGGARAGTLLVGPELGVFLGAVLVGSGSNLFSRVLNRPSAISLAPGLWLIVPGSVGFTSVSKFLAQDVLSGVETAFKMVLIAIALVTGLLLANVLVKPRTAGR